MALYLPGTQKYKMYSVYIDGCEVVLILLLYVKPSQLIGKILSLIGPIRSLKPLANHIAYMQEIVK